MSRRGARFGWIALSVLAGCRQVLGVEDRAEMEDPAPPAPHFSFPAGACASCVSTNCTDESEACWNNAACREIFTCIAPCDLGNENCRAACADSPNEPAFRLAACHAQACGPDCALDCGGFVGMALGVVLPLASTDCVTCAADAACSEYDKCASSDSCIDFGLCVGACSAFDLGCRHVCAEQFKEGHNLSLAVNTAIAPCLGTCTSKPDWSCRENVSWPTPTEDASVPLELLVYGYPDNNPLEGATVRACDDTSVDCVEVGVALGASEADGSAVVAVPVVPTLTGAFGGYLEVIAAGRMPLLAYPAVFPASTQFLGSLPVSPRALFEQIAMLSGDTFEDDLGAIAVFVTDCNRNPARRVRVTLEPADGATPIYLKSGAADPTANETDQSGIMGFVNVTPGRLTLTAEVTLPGNNVVSRRLVWVRPNAETYIQLGPTP